MNNNTNMMMNNNINNNMIINNNMNNYMNNNMNMMMNNNMHKVQFKSNKIKIKFLQYRKLENIEIESFPDEKVG